VAPAVETAPTVDTPNSDQSPRFDADDGARALDNAPLPIAVGPAPIATAIARPRLADHGFDLRPARSAAVPSIRGARGPPSDHA
jgi:hypothetical protein